MKVANIFLILLRILSLSSFLFIPVFIFAQESNLKALEDWQLAKNSDGVKVYVRRIEAEPGRVERQLKAEMTMNASLSAAVATLRDDKELTHWINRAVESFNFNIKDNHFWNNYIQFQIPWPLNNQDVITKNYLSQDSLTRIVTLTIYADNDKLPVRDHVDRIPSFEGSWTIKPVGNGKISLAYTIYAGQKPWLPWWVISAFVEYGVWKTLIDMRTVIRDKYTRGVTLDYIRPGEDH